LDLNLFKRKEGLNSAERKAKWSQLANCKAGDYFPNEKKSATSHFFPFKNNTLWYLAQGVSLYAYAAERTLSQDGYFLLGRKLLECADGFKKLTSLKDKNFQLAFLRPGDKFIGTSQKHTFKF
jgi:hypothetical protein